MHVWRSGGLCAIKACFWFVLDGIDYANHFDYHRKVDGVSGRSARFIRRIPRKFLPRCLLKLNPGRELVETSVLRNFKIARLTPKRWHNSSENPPTNDVISPVDSREKRRRCQYDPKLGINHPMSCDADSYFGAADYTMRNVWDSAGR